MSPPTAIGLLKLLDTEETGHVLIDEFLCSLNRLHGDNLSVHLATNMHESKKILQSIAQVRRLLEPHDASAEQEGDRSTVVLLADCLEAAPKDVESDSS